jgi:hypothetical protein
MEIKPIRTKTDYRKALKEIETLMNAQAGSGVRTRFPRVAPGPIKD